MDLTNKPKTKNDRFALLSKSMKQNEKLEPLTNPSFCQSDTLLLDSSNIHQQTSFLIKSSKQGMKSSQKLNLKLDQANFSFQDSKKFLQFTNGCEHCKYDVKNNNYKDLSLEKVCYELLKAIKNLQIKTQAIKEIEQGRNHEFYKNSKSIRQDNILEKKSKNAIIFDKKQSIQSHYQPTCNENFVAIFHDLIKVKTELKVQKSQNESIHKELVELQLINDQYKSSLKKIKTENIKLKQLLRQYQLYNKNKSKVENDENLKNELQSSLDKRWGENNQQQLKKVQKNYEYNYVQQADSLFCKQSPKSPTLYSFYKIKSMLNSQKPQLICSSNLQKWIEESQIYRSTKNERKQNKQEFIRTHYVKSNNVKVRRDKQSKIVDKKYSSNSLLKRDHTSSAQHQSSVIEFDYFSTMESLPSLSSSIQDEKQFLKKVKYNRSPFKNNSCIQRYRVSQSEV